jgi:hypothetical protein
VRQSRRRRGAAERGQSTVEWVGLLLLLVLLLAALVATGVRVPGDSLARAIASRILCAVAIADSCGDEPALIAAYGTEVGALARDHMPTLAFEQGSHGLPVDWRRCRTTACGDGGEEGAVRHSDAGLPVTAFVHVVDCRSGSRIAGDVDCAGGRAGHLYLQYWLYYADSATFRGVPIAEEKGFHEDDWESVQVRIDEDGEVDQRASSHHGYNYRRAAANLASDAGVGPLREFAEAVGVRAENGWGPETGFLLVSGGSHAGNLGDDRGARYTPAGAVHLVPLEPIAAADATAFAVSPPWLKKVWRDPEAEGTD